MKLPRWLLTSECTIERYAGDGADGPTFSAATTHRCLVEDKRRLVTAGGVEQVAQTTVFLEPDVAAVPVESRITVSGRESIVMQVLDHVAPGLPTPDHLELVVQ